MAENKPTLHHLNNSQSQRILWLLEELNIDYDLVQHTRNAPNHPTASFRSPPSLLESGPYGKAPLLITGEKDGKRQIPESTAIATYLIRRFDTSDKFGLKNGDWIRDEVLINMATTNLTRVNGFLLYKDFGALKFGEGALTPPQLDGVLKDLDRELEEGPKGGFFMGENPGRADIILEFPMTIIKHRNWVDMTKDFPKLDAWLQRVYARDAFKMSLQKGNGYDLSVFPKRG